MCIQGSQPVEGVNYFASSDLYSPTVNGSEVKLLTAIAAEHGTLWSLFYCSAVFQLFPLEFMTKTTGFLIQFF
jgi:hypothetical protein